MEPREKNKMRRPERDRTATQLRTLRRVSHERAWEIAVPGVAYVGLGGLLSCIPWLA
jgi:hypothetical protein